MLMKVDLGFLFSFFFSVFSVFVSDSFAFCLLPQQLLFYTWVMKWVERTIEYSDSVPLGYVRL